MISSLSPSAMTFLNGMDIIERRSDQAQTELTTGLQINSVSDSPGQIPLLMQLDAQLSRTQQINTNMNQVQSEVDTGQNALQSAVSLTEQAETLTTQGQTSFADADTRQQIATQIGTIMTQMVNLANTTSGGRYIFSGNSDQTQPYTIDLTQTDPISEYAGSASTRQVQAPDGSTFSIALNAQDIFDSGTSQNNVFEALNSARTALLNDDQTGINSALTTLQSADTYLNDQLAFYGNVQDQVSSATNYGSSLVTQLKTQLAGIEDANTTQAITELTAEQTDQEAALASYSKIPTNTLFNYLG